MSDDPPFTIGQAINLLKEEFPEVTVSKVRFLETRDLIRPRRSASGYREFNRKDLDRIRYILREQRDHFTPLKVIKSKLAAWERGEGSAMSPSKAVPPEAFFAAAQMEMTSQELARSAGLPKATIDDMVDQKVLDPVADENGRSVFGADDLTIARAARRLLDRGLEVRHLRTLRIAANKEIDLISQLAGPLLRHKSPANRERAAEIMAECAQAARELAGSISRQQLRRQLEA